MPEIKLLDNKKQKIVELLIRRLHFGANEVVIYNFLALITIDTNINQFIKVYHIFYKIQDQFKKYIKPIKKPGFKSEEEQTCSFVLIIHNKFVYSH